MVDRPLIPAMRRLLLVASQLVLAVGIPLMLKPTETADYFSWTIQPPLTAAFLGSAYWASFLLEFEASRRRTWDYARIAVPAVFAFTVLTLIATLSNLERFHFGDPGVIVTIVTWGWLLVYAIVLTVGVLRLAQGEAAFNGWLQALRSPASLLLHAVLLVSMVVHAHSWFDIMPKTMPLIFIGGRRLAASTIQRTGWSATVVVTVAVFALALWART